MAILSVFFIVVSIFSFCIKTHPNMRVPVIYNRTSIRLPASGIGGGLLSSLYRWPYFIDVLKSTGASGSAAVISNLTSGLTSGLANITNSMLNNMTSLVERGVGITPSSVPISSLSRVATNTNTYTHHHLPPLYGMFPLH